MGFCPPGVLSSLDFVRLDIVLWVFVQWDFVLIPVRYVTKKINLNVKNGGNPYLLPCVRSL